MSKLEVDAIEPQSGTTLTIGASGDTIIVPAGTVSLPAITTTGDTNTGIFFPAADTIAFTEGGAEAMRINSSGNVGIGETVPLGKLHVKTADSGASVNAVVDELVLEGSGRSGMTILSGSSSIGAIAFGDSGSNTIASINYDHSDNNLNFYTNGSERMRIDNSGAVVIGKTAQDTTAAGLELLPSGILVATRADVPLFINRLSTDGILVLLQQNNTTEGTISVSGTTVSYNGFTGTHWSRFQDNSTPTILKGTVLESLDEMCDWYNLEFDVTTTTQDEDGNDVTETHTKKIPHVLTDTQSNGDVITYNHEGTDYQATIVKENDVKHMMSKSI
jgi:hypothetical protein